MKDSRRRAISVGERIERYILDVRRHLDKVRFPLETWTFRQGHFASPPDQYSFDGPWAPYTAGMTWGGEDKTAWFRTTVSIPAAMEGHEVLISLYPGGEGILRVDHQPVFGVDFNHREYRLTDNGRAGEQFEIELECYVRDAPDDAIRNDIRTIHRFEAAALLVRDREIEALYYDLSVALDLARAFESTRPDLAARLMRSLQDAVARLNPYAADSRAWREEALRAHVFLQKALYDKNRDRPEGVLDLVGHCHIDLYYVWPYRESVRKNLRTNLIAGEMMRRWPEYLFTQSQAKLFFDLKQYAPEVFENIRDLAAQGRFETVGGMWVETDGNIPCGEAWVRQILYGRKFFKTEFGSESSVCWMPDVFGVGHTIPQILIQAGFSLFYTNKQAVWHDTNEFPHNTFMWEGLDGSRILAHIPPTHFVGKMDPQSVLWQWSEYVDKTEAPRVMYTYGFGDGGGGPTEQMLEYAKRLIRMDGVPALQFSTAEQFSGELKASARDLPVWADELYLEMHRGVQTTKGALKRLNRRAESLLRENEILSSLGEVLGWRRADTAEMEACWKILLECHFHDAVTGTHCTEAGDEIENAYGRLLVRVGKNMEEAGRALMGPGDGQPGFTLLSLAGAVTRGHVEWDGAAPAPLVLGGRSFSTQELSSGRMLTYVEDFPALGHQAVTLAPQAAPGASPFRITDNAIHSPHYEAVFDDAGCLESLHDLDCDRSVLSAPGNHFKLFEDMPGRFEAWDIAKDYPRRPVDCIRLVRNEPGQCGELAASRILAWSIGEASLITQEILFYAHSRRIDFITHIDWHEERKLLRVEFPLNVLASRATYETAFGAVTRSTRPVSLFDKAKFEVTLHRWMDTGEHGYGVALLNDGKYGGSVQENIMALSLLKSPRFPDPTSDIGSHTFTYSLLPHAGRWQEAGVYQEAFLLNTPLRLMAGRASEERMEYFRVSQPGVAVESFKPAEDGDGCILRLVDYFGQRAAVDVVLPRAPGSVEPCSVIEEPLDSVVSVKDREFTFACRPFGIHSFRIRFSIIR